MSAAHGWKHVTNGQGEIEHSIRRYSDDVIATVTDREWRYPGAGATWSLFWRGAALFLEVRIAGTQTHRTGHVDSEVQNIFPEIWP